MADVLAIVWAGAVYLLHEHLTWLGKQLFPTKSERPFLLDQAGMYGIKPTPATFAAGTVRATGADSSPIPKDSILIRDDAATYLVTADAAIASGIADLSVQAVTAGAAGNLSVGDTLTFESPVAGVDTTVTVIDDATTGDGITGGFDQEDIEDMRRRFLLHQREKPQGGTDEDYRAWALAVAGVTRAWVYPREKGLGTVVVRFVMDHQADIFPDAAAVQAVQDALDAQRPTTAEVTAEAPTALAVNFTISITPDTAAIRTAVEAELADLLRRVAAPGDGAGRGKVLLSHMRDAVFNATDVEDYDVTVPSADVVPATGQLAVRGAVTWV